MAISTHLKQPECRSAHLCFQPENPINTFSPIDTLQKTLVRDKKELNLNKEALNPWTMCVLLFLVHRSRLFGRKKMSTVPLPLYALQKIIGIVRKHLIAKTYMKPSCSVFNFHIYSGIVTWASIIIVCAITLLDRSDIHDGHTLSCPLCWRSSSSLTTEPLVGKGSLTRDTRLSTPSGLPVTFPNTPHTLV